MQIFDRLHLNHTHTRSRALYADHDIIIRAVWDQIIDRLHDIKRSFQNVLVLGPRGADDMCQTLKIAKKIEQVTILQAISDAEILPYEPAHFDLILSAFDLHTINDLPGIMIQIRTLLKPDGVLLAAFPGGETLYELRQAMMMAELELTGGGSPRILPWMDKQQAGALLQRGKFALPVADSEKIIIEYGALQTLLHDLRGMGESNVLRARSKKPVPRSFFKRTEEIYRAAFGMENGRLPATFEILHMIGWAPAASQQQPLKPGSATSRLADILGTNEMGAGERP
jgi:NADH dehydrogenase [ubiquinone] 1 alpha subcomplex assembly factor 5